MSTFISGETVHLVPEREEVKFVGVLRGAPWISSEARGLCEVTWDRLQKIPGESTEGLVQGTDPEPPVLLEIETAVVETEKMAEVVDAVVDAGLGPVSLQNGVRDFLPEEVTDVTSEESKSSGGGIPKRITKKWLSSLSSEQLRSFLEDPALTAIPSERRKKLQDELSSR